MKLNHSVKLLKLIPALISIYLLSIQVAGAATCSFSAVTGINFGNYISTFNTATTSNGSFKIICSNVSAPITFTVTLSRGASSSFNPRTMTNGSGGTLNYNIYRDPNMTSIFGDGTGGSSLINGSCSAGGCSPDEPTVYGKIPPLQTSAVAGQYSDTLVLTINY